MLGKERERERDNIFATPRAINAGISFAVKLIEHVLQNLLKF